VNARAQECAHRQGERVGRRILETLVELERGADLPVDLPWMPYIVGDQAEVTKAGRSGQ
jgi:hypothetical protein